MNIIAGIIYYFLLPNGFLFQVGKKYAWNIITLPGWSILLGYIILAGVLLLLRPILSKSFIKDNEDHIKSSSFFQNKPNIIIDSIILSIFLISSLFGILIIAVQPFYHGINSPYLTMVNVSLFFLLVFIFFYSLWKFLKKL